jgi:acyl carrier protein
MPDLEEVFRVPVIESYGMTEAAHQMASNPLPPAVRKAGSVGLPAGPEMGILDDMGNLLPPSDAGEIVIRGANVTMGYVNNPQANEEAFTNGWFRTGDLGYRDDEGYFYIRGRKKEMINRGGENISPREIDEVLLEHPAVAQAVTFAVPHASLGEDLYAAIVPHEQSGTDENALRRFAAGGLAPHKVPSRILTLESIPLGPTGKIQRIGLHKALEDQLRIEYKAPSNDLERDIVASIERILQTNPVGATENFFALGGDSLKAASLLARLSTQYQVELPPVSLFYNPTARELGLEITRLMGEDAGVLEELLAEVEEMSDEQARSELDVDPGGGASHR